MRLRVHGPGLTCDQASARCTPLTPTTAEFNTDVLTTRTRRPVTAADTATTAPLTALGRHHRRHGVAATPSPWNGRSVIILLALIMAGLLGVAVIIAGVERRSPLICLAGAALVIGAVVTAVAIRTACDPGCDVGSGDTFGPGSNSYG